MNENFDWDFTTFVQFSHKIDKTKSNNFCVLFMFLLEKFGQSISQGNLYAWGSCTAACTVVNLLCDKVVLEYIDGCRGVSS